MKVEISRDNFIASIPKPVFEIAKILKTNGYKAYLVGGSVRDILLGKTPDDFDVATDAVPQTLLDLFPRSIEVGAKFGTIIVLASRLGLEDTTAEEEEFQITTFRKDAQYINGRWPETVSFSKTIDEDLARRDFTINALALDLEVLDPEETSDLPLIDLFNGIHDLGNGVIRAVGDPIERMKEDNLRALRACRLAAKLEFTIEEETFSAVTAASTTLDQISIERIREEFLKTLDAPTPSIGIELMRRSHILVKFMPELLEGVGMEQNEYHVHDVYAHALRTCDVAERSIRLIALLHDIGKSRTKNDGTFYGHDGVGALMAKEILTRMKFSKTEIEHVVKVIELHMFNYLEDWSDAAVRRFLRKVGNEEVLKDLFLLRIADAVANPKSEYDPENLKELENHIRKVQMEDNALHLKDLRINGNDIKELGVLHGPTIGKILDHLLEQVIENPDLNDPDKLRELVHVYISKQNEVSL